MTEFSSLCATSHSNYHWMLIKDNIVCFNINLCISFSKLAQVEDLKTNENEWVLANINVTGYYRVNYDQANWERLLNVLQTSRQVRINKCIKNKGNIVKDNLIV